MNILLTWASGAGFCQLPELDVFLKSSQRVNARKVALTHDMPEEAVKKFGDFGFEVKHVKLASYPLVDRHFYFWEFLLKNECESVLHVDSRDVLFQADPFDALDLTNSLFLIDEGIPSTSSGFHLIEQLEYQKDVRFKTNVRGPYVLNGGVTIGSYELMKTFHLLVWAASLKSSNTTDQATINYLYNFLKNDSHFRIAPSRFCLTGEAVKDSFVKPDIIDGEFYEKSDKYCIFHQWDRTEYAEQIKELNERT